MLNIQNANHIEIVSARTMYEDYALNLYDRKRVSLVASRKVNPIIRDVFFFHLVRASTYLKSMAVLSKSIQTPAIPAILRALLEILFQVNYISSDKTEYLCKRFSDMTIPLRLRTFYLTLKDYKQYLTSCDEKQKQSYSEAMNTIKEYGLTDILDVRKWCDTSFKKMAEISKLSKLYTVDYNRWSESVHCGSASDVDYEHIRAGVVVPCPCDQCSDLSCGISYFLHIYSTVCKGVGWNFKDAAYEFINFEAFCNEVNVEFRN